MDQLYLMKVFIAVGKEQSLAAAARRLDLSPEAVGRAVSTLEAQLGNKLLLRTARSVRLTDVGQHYLAGLMRIMERLAKADEAVTGIKLSHVGRLKVTAPPMLGKGFVIPCIADYMSQFPDVEVWGYFSDRTVNLVDEGVDVAVRVGRLADSSLKSIRVGSVRGLLCASPSYLARHAAPQDLSDLRKHAIIATSTLVSSGEIHPGSNDVGANSKIRFRLTVTSHDAAIEAAEAGLGIVWVLGAHVRPLLESGRLVPVLPSLDTAPVPVQVVHREGNLGSPKVRDFIDLLVARLRSNSSLN
jgi:DNA-binding transcriptional LysR family regulator